MNRYVLVIIFFLFFLQVVIFAYTDQFGREANRFNTIMIEQVVSANQTTEVGPNAIRNNTVIFELVVN